jgi:hypothetical protein
MAGFHNCDGREAHKALKADAERADNTGRKLWLSPREYHYMRDDPNVLGKPFVCSWPACDCPLTGITGAFHNEKFEWLAQWRSDNPGKPFPKVNVRTPLAAGGV